MNDSTNPYKFDAEPENTLRTGDFDLEDYENDEKNNPPWPKTPFVIELYRRKRFRKEYYRLTVNQDDFFLESKYLDVPIHCSRSSAEKCLFWRGAALLITYPDRKSLQLKPVSGENWGGKYALLVAWAEQIDEKKDCQARVRDLSWLFTAGDFIVCTFIFLFINYFCMIFAWLNFFPMPILFKIIWTIWLLLMTFLTRQALKRIWPLYILFIFFLVLTIFIASYFFLSHDEPNSLGLLIPGGICLMIVRLGIYGIIRLRRTVKDPLYKENVGEL